MKEKWFTVLSRYKFPAIMLLLGVVLMLLPLGKKTAVATQETPPQEFDLAAMERQMEEIVGCIDGVGRVKVMLTLRTGPTLSLASDQDETLPARGKKFIVAFLHEYVVPFCEIPHPRDFAYDDFLMLP